MDEADLIDWYDVVEAAANGQLATQACPKCGKRRLSTSQQGSWMRIRCADCGEGFEGRMSGARDDAFMAEADAMLRRAEAGRAQATTPATTSAATPAATPAATAAATSATSAGEPGVTRYDPPAPAAAGRGEPWSWQLPAESGHDLDGLSLWMDTVQAVHNGRRTGLGCPFCSEPLSEITVRDPFVRIRCGQCGEGFEGRIG